MSTTKKSAVENVVNITTSAHIKQNVGKTVKTPSGKIFKVLRWQTAKEHGENTSTTAYGSKLVAIIDGHEKVFYNNPCGRGGKLTTLYEECGLETSGQSGDRKQKVFQAAKNLEDASDRELAEEMTRLQSEVKRREEEAKRVERLSLLESLTDEELATILASRK